ncbi:fimbrial biogenesis outer membrane usher protein [Shigella flexneri]|nr:fimbrial biogenesis outer membrane usher protein [Shigella flexneri]
MFYRLSLILIMALLAGQLSAQEWSFDSSQLEGNVSADTVAMFNQGEQLPGNYRVEIYLNGEKVDVGEFPFHRPESPEEKEIVPCLTVDDLIHYGIKIDKSSSDTDNKKNQCFKWNSIEGLKVNYDFDSQRVQITVPQLYLQDKKSSLAPVSLWNEGVAAFRMVYQTNIDISKQNDNQSTTRNSRYGRFTPGFNLGAWRFRSSVTWSKELGQSERWQRGYMWFERGINAIKSRLTLGESYTSSEVFDSIPFRGGMLATDDAMTPPEDSYYTPVVHGIAQSEAQVIIKQNGQIIFTRSVPPGPFALDNLPTLAVGGELDVTVRESNGEEQYFSVPFQTPAIALHEGYFKYSVMGGNIKKKV